jgi:hypothetical protein
MDYIEAKKAIDIFKNASEQTFKYAWENKVLQSHLLSLFDCVSKMAINRFEYALW